MDQEKHYRHEMKYSIPYGDYLALRSRIRGIMTTDPHVSENGTYQIRSIYFDNADDKALALAGLGIATVYKRRR